MMMLQYIDTVIDMVHVHVFFNLYVWLSCYLLCIVNYMYLQLFYLVNIQFSF